MNTPIDTPLEIFISDARIEDEPYQCEVRPDKEHEHLLLIYDYWKSKCLEYGRLPKLSEIELLDLWQGCKYIFIVDLEGECDETARLRYRYFGTAVCDFSKMDMTGKYMDEIFRVSTLAHTTETYITVLKTGLPNVWGWKWNFKEELPRKNRYTRILVPLLNKEGNPGHLLGIFHQL